MKVIFLDIDGVLNTSASLAENVHLLPEKALLIRRIIEATGAKIVISSVWRIFMDDDANDCRVRFALKQAGIPDSAIIGATTPGGWGRAEQLRRWIVGEPVECFVIIDDEIHDFSKVQKSRLIKTKTEIGLTWEGAAQAIALLNGKEAA